MSKKLAQLTILALLLCIGASCSLFHKKDDELLMRPKKLTEAEVKQLLSDVEIMQTHADKGRRNAVTHKATQMRFDFPKISAFDLEPLVKAELYIARGKWLAGAKTYQKMLDEFPESVLKEPALMRLFTIGNIYNQGKKKAFLGLFKVDAYAEGAKLLDRVTEEAGLEDPNGLGVRAALNVVDRHEKREKYEDAYLKWLEISTIWQRGDLGRQALLGMARTKRAAYNANPQEKRPFYDGANLKAAKTYYEKFRITFPDEAETLKIEQIISDIERQMAQKELTIGQYYQRIGKEQAANIYFDLVIRNWPNTPAAQQAREITKADSR
jgi:tetratricopeptide (TPR) repeat protein